MAMAGAIWWSLVMVMVGWLCWIGGEVANERFTHVIYEYF